MANYWETIIEAGTPKTIIEGEPTRAGENDPTIEIIGRGNQTYIWIGTETCLCTLTGREKLETLVKKISEHLAGNPRKRVPKIRKRI